MIHDLSQQFEEAHRNSEKWNDHFVLDALQRIAVTDDGLRVDWEAGDEQWGRVLAGNSVVALVCARVPLVFLHPSLGDIGWTWCKDYGIVVAISGNFDQQSFSVRPALLKHIFSKDISDNVSCDSLSLNDLWWATV